MTALVHNTYDLQDVVTNRQGRLDLNPADTFILDEPTCRIDGEIEAYLHGATITHDRRWKQQSAPMFSGAHMNGILDGGVTVGTKDPDDPGYASRAGHAAFWLGAAHDLVLSNWVASHFAGDFVYLGAYRTGNAKTGITHELCRRVTLDNFHGIDAGRHRICAIGVGFADGHVVYRPTGPATDVGTRPGLTIKANCTFRGWQSARTDREAWAGYRTPRAAISDRSTSTKRL